MGNNVRNTHARWLAGQVATGAILAAGHWFPWWRPLGKLGAYAYGCTAIAIGQGIYYKFDKRWLRLMTFVTSAGIVVMGAYWYDGRARKRALSHVGVGSDGA